MVAKTVLNSTACLLVFAAGLASCGPAEPSSSTMPSEGPASNASNAPFLDNGSLLDEVNSAKTWFHAKKVRPIWARLVDREQEVETLEGRLPVAPGDYLCRGAAGEVWPQKADKLLSKYDATDEVDADGWRKYAPRPDAEGVYAAKIPHPFAVQATWGTLQGKAGDFLIKRASARDVAHPDDVWLVDAELFDATYERKTPALGSPATESGKPGNGDLQ